MSRLVKIFVLVGWLGSGLPSTHAFADERFRPQVELSLRPRLRALALARAIISPISSDSRWYGDEAMTERIQIRRLNDIYHLPPSQAILKSVQIVMFDQTTTAVRSDVRSEKSKKLFILCAQYVDRHAHGYKSVEALEQMKKIIAKNPGFKHTAEFIPRIESALTAARKRISEEQPTELSELSEHETTIAVRRVSVMHKELQKLAESELSCGDELNPES